MAYTNLSKTLPEILTEAVRFTSDKEKVQYISLYKGKGMRFFIRSLYDERWASVIIPNYKPSTHPAGYALTSISKSVSRLEAVLNLSNTNTEKSKELFQLVLESVTADESVLLTHLVTKKIIPGITKEIFREVYPELFTESK